MAKLVQCIGYLALIGILSFIIGRVLPKKWFNWNSAPFSPFPGENGGKIYDRLHIRKWKDIMPDMSKILPAVMPGRAPKESHGTKEEMELLLQETCIAEAVHGALCAVGFGCAWIWPGWPGLAIALLNVLANIPFILIQRYNRPRLCRMYQRKTAAKRGGRQISNYEGETA